MKSFAFITHPLNIKQIKNLWPITKFLPDYLIRILIKNILPFRVLPIKGVESSKKEEIPGYLIICPLLPEQILNLDKDSVLNTVITAGRIAERLGVSILGLGGYACLISDKGYSIAKELKIPVTCGSVFASWSIFEAIYRVSRAKNKDLKKSKLAIIGIDNPIGSLSAKKLATYVSGIIIDAKNKDESRNLKEEILQLSPIEVNIEEDAHKIAQEADIIILTPTVTSMPFSTDELKPDVIVCDFSMPRLFKDKTNLRKDVTIINGGLVKTPFYIDWGIDIGLAKDTIYACMAEIILLTLEERFVNYSLGDKINLDKLEEIADIAVQHNFEVWLPETPVL